MSQPLLWEFPGGKLHQGESAPQALARELWEELGVRVDVGVFIAQGEALIGEGVSVRLDVYRARLTEGQPEAREHAQLRWVHLDELDGYDWPLPDLPAVEVLMRSVGSSLC
jgi:8-oxo-dGTP diphosphatase